MNPTARFNRGWSVAAGFLAAGLWIGCSPGKLILPGQGITGITIGDPEEMVVAALGEPERKTTRGVAGSDAPILEYYFYPSQGLDIFFRENRIKTIFLYNEGSEDHRKFHGKTPDGLHLGSSRSDILRLMGQPAEKGEGAFEDRLYKYRHGIEFTFLPDDTLHHMVIRTPIDLPQK